MKKAFALAVLALTLSLLVLVATISLAAKPRKFDTIHEAATYTAIRLEVCSHYYECSGMIWLAPDGKYAAGPVRTDYESGSVKVHQIAPIGYRVVADVHSHPCLPNSHTGVFSESDIISSITTRTVGYMVDLCTGDVHEFIPGQTRVDEEEVENGVFLTGGKIIGHVPAYPDDAKANEGF